MDGIEQRLARLSPEQREMLMRQAAQLGRSQRARILPQPRPDRIPLTTGQRRLWLLDQFSPGMLAYNMGAGMWLEGALDAPRLRASAQGLMDRHESLRTVFRAHAGQPFQHILAGCQLPWQAVAVDGTDRAQGRAGALRIANEALLQPFDLAVQPPLRALLITVADDLHLFVLMFHHIAVDGWSMSSLIGELFDDYGRAPDAPALVAPALQIADVALWQQEALSADVLKKHYEFWGRHLADAPATLDLPTDHVRPAVQNFRGALWVSAVPEALYTKLERFARERQTTLSIVMFAALQALLARYSGQERVVTSMGTAGRSRLELEAVTGFFINLMPLQADLSADPDFATLLQCARDNVVEAMDHSDAPLDGILEHLRMPRSASITPFAQVLYFFQSFPQRQINLPGLRVEDVHLSALRPPTSICDLLVLVNQHAPGELMFEYSTDLYDESTIRRLCGHWLTLLAAAIESPQTPVSRLPLLTADEIAEQARWNDTLRELPADPTIGALFQAQVASTPDAVAVVFGEREMCYRELDRRANAVAHTLRGHGVGPGVLVGLYVERTLEMLVGLLGILKAGGAYVPLDPAYPADRLAYMMEMSASTVIVTQPMLLDSLPAAVPSVVSIGIDAPMADMPEAPPAGGAGPLDPAYVIFTSGSTGKPKGVEIRQRSAVNLIRSIAREPGMTADDTICAISTLSFDIALTELVVPLTVGARIRLVDRDTVRDGLRLRKLIESAPPTLLQATPAAWRMLLDVGWAGDTAMRAISTGEALPRELAERLIPMVRELWNLYGPTETTVYSALCRVLPGDGPVLVGGPVDNTRIHIVDRNMQPTPVGVPGELLIGGFGLAAGYRGRPDLTAEKFIDDPFGGIGDGRLYRTGDLAFWRADGTIQVVGRIDHQIKLRGFRIELGEIETVLAQYPGMTQVVVHCREDTPGDQRLVAYYTCENAHPADGELRALLKSALPEYMVPSAFVGLDAFPLTPNGKVDRRALPAPEATVVGQGQVLAPRTPEETFLVALWGELLHASAIDVRANFFDLGGHSVLGTKMLARIEHEYGIELSLRALFEATSLEALAARIADKCAEADQAHLEALLRQFENINGDDMTQQLASEGTKGTV